MKLAYQVVVVTAAVFAVLLLAPGPGLGQVTDDVLAEAEAARQASLAQRNESRAVQLTVFDREGNVVNTIGAPDVYSQPVVSPDRTRVAVIRRDFAAGTVDLWVFDLPNQPGKRASLGKTVTVEASRARDGSLSGLIRQITLADGTVISLCPQHC